MSLPPSQPDVTDYNERSMTLRWRAPIDDGGMKITAYNIEAKTAGEVGCVRRQVRWGRGEEGSAERFIRPRGSSVFVSLSSIFWKLNRTKNGQKGIQILNFNFL